MAVYPGECGGGGVECLSLVKSGVLYKKYSRKLKFIGINRYLLGRSVELTQKS